MDIDLAALRLIEREKEIPFDLLVRTIEQAMLLAYHRTEGAHPEARVELDRSSGHVVVWVKETDDAGAVREWDDTPEGFGRIAATTARQTILQRLRDAEDEQVRGERPALARKRGDRAAAARHRLRAGAQSWSSTSRSRERPSTCRATECRRRAKPR